MKVSKFPISLKNVSVCNFLSGFLSSNSTEITEVSKYTLVFLFIFAYRLGMAYNGSRLYEPAGGGLPKAKARMRRRVRPLLAAGQILTAGKQ
jgi:hypothetical protein